MEHSASPRWPPALSPASPLNRRSRPVGGRRRWRPRAPSPPASCRTTRSATAGAVLAAAPTWPASPPSTCRRRTTSSCRPSGASAVGPTCGGASASREGRLPAPATWNTAASPTPAAASARRAVTPTSPSPGPPTPAARTTSTSPASTLARWPWPRRPTTGAPSPTSRSRSACPWTTGRGSRPTAPTAHCSVTTTSRPATSTSCGRTPMALATSKRARPSRRRTSRPRTTSTATW